MKFIKRLFSLLIFSGLILGGVGYYYGLRFDNAEEFIGELFSDSQSDGNSFQEDISSPDFTKDYETPDVVYEFVDDHARSCPTSAENDISSLAAYLEEEADTDLEKARSIYVWITANLTYDDVSYNSDSNGDNSASGTLKNKTAVCGGFSNLFYELGREMGLEIKKVSGYSKGYSFSQSGEVKLNHAWNLIKIENEWRVFDATWGRGYSENVNGKLKSFNEFEEFWFNCDPYAAIFSHMPENPEDAHVNPKVDVQIFKEIPKVDKGYFELGFDAEETYQNVYDDYTLRFPKTYTADIYAELISAPEFETLYVGDRYHFKFFIPEAIKVALIADDGSWSYFDEDNGVFEIDYKAKTLGELRVGVNSADSDGKYPILLTYQVER